MYLGAGYRILEGMHSGERWRLGHRPALDGLRGIAILLVLANHGFVPWFLWAGGAVGVAVFFTLSGFLITSLLLRDQETSGRIRFGRFYARRARRLLPGLLALIVVVLGLGTVVDGILHWQTVAGTLGYSANWVMAAGPLPGDVLGHTWSLSIEEQFYLVWPVVFGLLARRSLRLVLGVGGVVCVASLFERFVLFDPALADNWRIYFGTDTRADGLLYGCMLAVLMRSIRVERARPELVTLGLGGILWATALRGGGLSVLGPTVVSLSTAAVIFGASQGAGFRGLEWRPLRWVGERSYGVYLWHAPVAVVMGRLIGHDDWWVYAPALLAGSLVAAAASWTWVEQPFLRRRSGDAGDAPDELEARDVLVSTARRATGEETDMGRGQAGDGDRSPEDPGRPVQRAVITPLI